MEIIFAPSLLGFISRREALRQGATRDELAKLDFLRYRRATYYRQIDVERLPNVKKKAAK